MKEEEKKEENREIKSIRNIFLGGEDKSIFELFKRDKKTSTPSLWSRRQVEARSKSHSPEEKNKRQSNEQKTTGNKKQE